MSSNNNVDEDIEMSSNLPNTESLVLSVAPFITDLRHIPKEDHLEYLFSNSLDFKVVKCFIFLKNNLILIFEMLINYHLNVFSKFWSKNFSISDSVSLNLLQINYFKQLVIDNKVNKNYDNFDYTLK